jgi:hypothetical protein
MNNKIKELAEQSFDIIKDNRGRVEYSADSYGIEKFAELIVRECISCVGSQADKAYLKKRFGLPVESDIHYPAGDSVEHMKSQYNRSLNLLTVPEDIKGTI